MTQGRNSCSGGMNCGRGGVTLLSNDIPRLDSIWRRGREGRGGREGGRGGKEGGREGGREGRREGREGGREGEKGGRG